MVPAILAIDQRLHSGQRVVATTCRERRINFRSFVVSGNTKVNIHHHPSQEHESIGYSRFSDPHIGMDFQHHFRNRSLISLLRLVLKTAWHTSSKLEVNISWCHDAVISTLDGDSTNSSKYDLPNHVRSRFALTSGF